MNGSRFASETKRRRPHNGCEVYKVTNSITKLQACVGASVERGMPPTTPRYYSLPKKRVSPHLRMFFRAPEGSPLRLIPIHNIGTRSGRGTPNFQFGWTW